MPEGMARELPTHDGLLQQHQLQRSQAVLQHLCTSTQEHELRLHGEEGFLVGCSGYPKENFLSRCTTLSRLHYWILYISITSHHPAYCLCHV